MTGPGASGSYLPDRRLCLLESAQYDKALNFLNKVRANSYYAPRALYLHGLAQARKENYRGAMQFWHRARKYPLAYPGVAEATMGMGYAFDESGYLGQAGDAYLGASSAFEKELVNIQTLQDQIRDKGAWQSLLLASQQDNVEWFLADSKSLTAPRLAYLTHMMADPRAQFAVRRVAELDRIRHRLQRQSHDLDVFATMLQRRLDKVTGSRNDRDVARLRARRADLEKSRSHLQERLQKAVSGNDLEALVSGKLSSQFDRVKKLAATARRQGASAEVQGRIQRLQGLLIWQAEEQRNRNERLLREQLDQASSDLNQIDSLLAAFDQRLNEAPAHFRSLLKRVKAQQSRLAQTQTQMQSLRKRSEAALDQVALAFFDTQGKALRAWRDRSNQEVAHLYEYLALTQRSRDKEAK